jgi:hypothetical protein
MKIIMTVDFLAEVPDNTDLEVLTLDIIPENVFVHDGQGKIRKAKVTGYTNCFESES